MEAQAGSECVIMAAMPRRRLAGRITGSKRNFTRDAGNGWRRSQKTSRSGSIPRCLKRTSTFLKKGKCGWRLANFYYAHYIPLSALSALSHSRLATRHAYVAVTGYVLDLTVGVHQLRRLTPSLNSENIGSANGGYGIVESDIEWPRQTVNPAKGERTTVNNSKHRMPMGTLAGRQGYAEGE